eukprot:10686300-Alexandrium_andersonii.AAC.1
MCCLARLWIARLRIRGLHSVPHIASGIRPPGSPEKPLWRARRPASSSPSDSAREVSPSRTDEAS